MKKLLAVLALAVSLVFITPSQQTATANHEVDTHMSALRWCKEEESFMGMWKVLADGDIQLGISLVQGMVSLNICITSPVSVKVTLVEQLSDGIYIEGMYFEPWKIYVHDYEYEAFVIMNTHLPLKV
tara:strand:+ start:478 stop:858 length:381 start_codon:yes stop_codon:yes gene_type:complete